MKTCPVRSLVLVAALAAAAPAQARDADEFRIKRQEVFEFSEKPAVTRDGDKVTVTFASTAFCDATVAVEDESGRVLRHPASCLLGPNAPEPLRRDSLKQTIVWDGKDG